MEMLEAVEGLGEDDYIRCKLELLAAETSYGTKNFLSKFFEIADARRLLLIEMREV